MLRRLILLFVLLLPSSAVAQEVADEPAAQSLEDRLSEVESDLGDRAGKGALLFLFGAFCALWAQQTRRSPVLWFFLGVFFSVLTVLILLIKNSNDRGRASSEAAETR